MEGYFAVPCSRFRVVERVVATLGDLFQLLLPNRLLYESEKPMFRLLAVSELLILVPCAFRFLFTFSVLVALPIFLQEKPAKPLVEIYGGLHLLRLLCESLLPL